MGSLRDLKRVSEAEEPESRRFIFEDGGKKVWIRVLAHDGMFSNECAVSIHCSGGTLVSLFVDRVLIKEHSGSHFLKVQCVRRDSTRMRVLLPQETFETGSRWVDIDLRKVV
jgi:hypothetical protein